MAEEHYYRLEVETMFANAQASKKPVLEALSDAIIAVLMERDTMRAALNAALDALKAAPKPPWNFRPTIGWQGDYCDWYEVRLGEGK